MSASEKVKSYWNRNPNQTRFIESEIGSKEFFDESITVRYKFHYHLPPLLKKIAESRPSRLLEVGCGMANDLVFLAQQNINVFGVDLTEKGIELANKHFLFRGLKATLKVADAENLPFEGEFFEAVYSFGVLHHTDHPDRAIDEVFRVLSKNGKAYIMLYNRNSLNYWAHRVLSAPFDGTKRDPCPVEKTYTKSEVKVLFKKFGNVKIEVDYLFGTGWGFVNKIIPVKIHRFLGKHIGWHLMIEATK